MTEALNHYLDQCDKDFENQEERELSMSRLSDDEKRFLTDQISMLKGENERLTKYMEDYKDDTMKLEIEAQNAQRWYRDCLTAEAENERVVSYSNELEKRIGEHIKRVDKGNEAICQLKVENEALRKLAHDYIQAYEKLAFGDALLTKDE